jgi:hypothetical protein
VRRAESMSVSWLRKRALAGARAAEGMDCFSMRSWESCMGGTEGEFGGLWEGRGREGTDEFGGFFERALGEPDGGFAGLAGEVGDLVEFLG